MAHMSDMEDLLNLIKDNDIKDYMKEAMLAYMSGSYRGCIVLSYIAVFDHLFKNLENIQTYNKNANEIYKAIDIKVKQHKTFENDIVDQLHKAHLITPMDYKDLKRLIDLRNDSAHPSGRKPSAEEARYIFSDAIKKFLSKEVTSNRIEVDELIIRIKHKLFFTSNKIENVVSTVNTEINNLHDSSYRVLIPKILQELESSLESYEQENLFFFLNALFNLYKENSLIVNQQLIHTIIIKKYLEPNWEEYIVSFLIGCPKIIVDLEKIDKIHVERIQHILANHLKNSEISLNENVFNHPVNVILILANAPENHVLLDLFKDLINDTIIKYKKNPEINEILKKDSIFFKNYYDEIKSKIEQHDYIAINGFLSSINVYLDILHSSGINGEQAFELLAAIYKASDHGAWKAERIVKNEFNEMNKIKNNAKNYIDATSKELLEKTLDKYHLGSHKFEKFLELFR